MYYFITIHSKQKEISIKIYLFMPLLIYVFYALCLVCVLIFFQEWWYNCYVLGLSTVIAYILAKFILYQYYLARLYSIYSSSAFKFNTKKLALLSIIIVIYTGITIALVVLNFKVTSNQQKIVYVCDVKIPVYIFGVSNAFDQIISCYSLYLFTKPIVYIVNLAHNDDSINIENMKQYRVLVKIYTLSSIQFITTLISLIMLGIGFGAPFSSTDAVINSICIALMNKTYINIYNKLCCFTHKLCQKCVIGCCVISKIPRKTPQIQNAGTTSNSTVEGRTDTIKNETTNAYTNIKINRTQELHSDGIELLHSR